MVNLGSDTPGSFPEPLAKEIEMLDGQGQGHEAGKALADELCCLRTLSKMSAGGPDAYLTDHAAAAAAASRLEAAIKRLESEQAEGEAARAEAAGVVGGEAPHTAGKTRAVRLLRKEMDRLRSRERTQQDVSRRALASTLARLITEHPPSPPTPTSHLDIAVQMNSIPLPTFWHPPSRPQSASRISLPKTLYSALSILQRNLGSMRTGLDRYCGDYLGDVLKGGRFCCCLSVWRLCCRDAACTQCS